MNEKPEETPTVRASRKYADKMKAKGLVRVAVWVPKKDREELLDIAQEMCEDVGAR